MKGQGKWSSRLPSGKVAIPFGFHINFPRAEIFKKWVLEMNKDLGCVELIHIASDKLFSTNWKNGILFVHTDDTPNDDWCRGALGMRPGYTSDNGLIEKYGAPKGWQMILMADDCSNQATAHHEVLHALGKCHSTCIIILNILWLITE